LFPFSTVFGEDDSDLMTNGVAETNEFFAKIVTQHNANLLFVAKHHRPKSD